MLFEQQLLTEEQQCGEIASVGPKEVPGIAEALHSQ